MTPFLKNSKRNLRGDKFSAILTHRSPEKKAAIKRAARDVGANVVEHPLNPGELLVLPAGKTLNDVLRFQTQKNGKALDLDPRDFTTFNENARPDARQYTNLNINDIINNINSRSKYLDNRSNWGKLNKIAQLKPADLQNLKKAIVNQGFNVETSMDKKGDPTLVFSKGRINPQWSIKDEYSAKEPEKADPAYLKEVVGRLQQAFPNVEISSTPEAYNKLVKQLKDAGYKPPPGAKGFKWGRKVGLKPGDMTKDTPIHELAHVWVEDLRSANPALWKRGVELLKGSDFMRVVDNIPEYHAIRKRGDLATFNEEVMANALGKRGAEIFARNREKATTWDKFRKKVGTWLKDKLNISSKKDYADLTLEDWLDIGAQSILTGDQTAFTAKPPTSKANIAYNVKEAAKDPKNKSITEKLDVAERAAKYYDTKKTRLEQLKNWVTPPSSDDFHGLVERFANKFPNSKLGNKLKELGKTYEKEYNQYEKNATDVRETAKTATDKLAKDLGIESKKLPAYLAEDSGIEIEGIPASKLELISNYNNNPKAKAYINNNKPLLDFYNNINNIKYGDSKFELDPQKPFQASLLDYINKGLLKASLPTFMEQSNALKGNLEIAKMGTGFQDAFNDSMFRMRGGGKINADTHTNAFSTWLQGSVGAIMFVNVRSAALQGLSTWNYASPGNFLKFNKDVASILNPKSEQRALFEELWNNPMLKERRARAGFDVNAAEVVEYIKAGKIQGRIGKVLNKGFFLTSLMDSVAIASGGVGFISNFKGSKAEAIAQWQSQTQEAQQSARPDRVSQQQKSAVSKFILAFANTPQQYFRLSQKAYRTIKTKGITSPEGQQAARKMFYYIAAQNAIFTMLQSGSMALFAGWDTGDEDERKQAENQLNSMSDTVLRGMGMFGAVASALKNVVLNTAREDEKARPDYGKAILKGAVGVAPPLSRKINDIQAIGNAYKYDEGKKGARSKEAIAVSRGLAAGLNIPADWLQKKLAAVQAHLIDKEATFGEMLSMIYGHSEYSVLGDKEEGEFNFDDFNFDDADFEFDDSAFEDFN